MADPAEPSLFLHEVIDIVGRGGAAYMAHTRDFDADGAAAGRGKRLTAFIRPRFRLSAGIPPDYRDGESAAAARRRSEFARR